LITSGAGRDLEQVRTLSFPAFTSGAICAHGYCHIPAIQAPVLVGGISVNPGDLLHGDCNGVTTIPGCIAAEVAQVCDQFVAAEAVVFDYLRCGSVTLKGWAEAEEECQSMIEKLREQVARK